MCYSTGEHECTYVHMPFLSVCLLLQTDEPDVINFLLTTEIIPLFGDHGVRERAVQDCECDDTDWAQLN